MDIAAVEPSTARPGDTILLIGRGFSPDLKCVLADVPAECIALDDARVELQVPTSLQVEGCHRSVAIELQPEAPAPHAPASLRLRRPAPAIASLRDVRPARKLQLEVTGLPPFSVTIAGRAVPSEAVAASTTKHSLTLEVPADLERGEHTLLLNDRCGESTQSITVRPTPTLNAGPTTLAADGVAELRVDHLEPDELLGIEVGGELLDPSQGDAVQWLAPASGDGASRLVLRAPSSLRAGSGQLKLITLHGDLEWSFEGVAPQGVYPLSPSGIIGVSPAASGVFPISTIAAGGIVTDSDAGATVSLDFEYQLYLRSAGRDDCPIARAGKGEIYGEEVVRNLRVSHPVIGEYELHSAANRVRVSIDRTSSGGVVEHYIGGWVRYPGADTSGVILPPPDQRATPAELAAGGALLLLTSEHTGRQLLIDRDLDDEEERYRMRGCMMELP